jgi:hypothetical protein
MDGTMDDGPDQRQRHLRRRTPNCAPNSAVRPACRAEALRIQMRKHMLIASSSRMKIKTAFLSVSVTRLPVHDAVLVTGRLEAREGAEVVPLRIDHLASAQGGNDIRRPVAYSGECHVDESVISIGSGPHDVRDDVGEDRTLSAGSGSAGGGSGEGPGSSRSASSHFQRSLGALDFGR